MSIPRSEDLWTAAYFLSRCGYHPNATIPADPPPQMHAQSWDEAYGLFFHSLGGGRTPKAFAHRLKNARDMFDGHLNSGRVGWREPGRERAPQPLGNIPARVFARWSNRTEDELWTTVRGYITTS